MPIDLPKTPDGGQYEDLVAAVLKGLGYFTETRLLLREENKDVLELDVVATPLAGEAQTRLLFEVKKEGFSFTNIFKVFGQRTYLNIPAACIVSPKPADPLFERVLSKKASEMAVRLCHFPVESVTHDAVSPAMNGLSPNTRKSVVEAAWYQQIARRIAYASFIHACKSSPGSELHQRAREYDFAVQDAYFEATPLARAEALYDAWIASPHLVGEMVTSLSGPSNAEQRVTWNRLNDTEGLMWLQSLMLIQNTARISIVKNALDDIMLRGASALPLRTTKIGNLTVEWPLHSLPQRFLEGLEVLRGHPHALRLPGLFQAYSELLGGFLFYRQPDELALMEAMTGIPQQEVVPCLRLLDHFFAPAGGTWFFEVQGAMLCMKMVPGFVRGGEAS